MTPYTRLAIPTEAAFVLALWPWSGSPRRDPSG